MPFITAGDPDLDFTAEVIRRLDAAGAGERGSPFHDVVAQVEAVLVRDALARTRGNQLRAAGLLELNRTTLRKKMQTYKL